MKHILAYGEIIWDVYPGQRVLGGAPLNFAAHIVRCGGSCELLSAVGDDKLGYEAMTQIESLGMSDRYIQTNGHPTGQCCVSINDRGVPSYHIVEDVSYDYIDFSGQIREDICDFDILYFGTLSQRSERSRKTLRALIAESRFSQIVCDVNLRPNCYDRESILLCLENATILKVSAEEEPVLRNFAQYAPKDESPGEIAKAICEKYSNIQICLITMGGDGSYGYERASGIGYSQPAKGDNVVSTVGAGDSYLAAFVVGTLNDLPMADRMDMAAHVSGFVVGCVEAIPRYTISELYKK